MSFLRFVCVAIAALSFATAQMNAAAPSPVKKKSQAAPQGSKVQPVKKPPSAAKAANPKVAPKKPTPATKPIAKPAPKTPATQKTPPKVPSNPVASKASPKKPSQPQPKKVASPKPGVTSTQKPAAAPKPAPASPKLSTQKTTNQPKKPGSDAPPSKTTTPPPKPQAGKVVTRKKTVPQSPKKPIQPNNDKLIILDAGHGGYDVGARVSACNEKSLALSTTLLTKKYLSDMGYRVILTRSRDIFIPLQKRTNIANQTKSKLFVSIHFNSAKNTEAKGIEIFYYNSKDKWRSGSSKKLARIVLNKIITRTGAHDRGVKNGNFHVIRETKMPAILVEGGFITHEGERHNLIDVKYREKLARGIAEGIHNYFKA